VRWLVLLAFLSLPVVPRPIDGQEATRSPSGVLYGGQDIRVAAGSMQHEGKVVSLARDSVLLETHFGRQRFAVAAFDSVWVRTTSVKHSAVKGGLISGAIFGGITLLACVAASGDSGSDCGNGGSDTFLFPVVYFGLGAVPGAAVGTLVGAVPRWHLRFAR
jgi:hypothetical protein